MQRKGGTSFRNNGYLRELGRIVRASPVELCEDQRHCYVYAQQRHMDHATRKSSCLHLSHMTHVPKAPTFFRFSLSPVTQDHYYSINASPMDAIFTFGAK